MMKVVAILMVIMAAITFNPSDAAACFKHWTRAQAGASPTGAGPAFTGIVNATTEAYNNPVYYALASAKSASVTTKQAKGRFSGVLTRPLLQGNMQFQFFASNSASKIKFLFKRLVGPPANAGTGTISSSGHTGCFSGVTGGTVVRKLIAGTDPKVFEWTFCPTGPAACAGGFGKP